MARRGPDTRAIRTPVRYGGKPHYRRRKVRRVPGAIASQRSRIYGQEPSEDPWRGTTARLFRFDPHRSLDPNLEVIASYVQPDDVVVDVGGGAGRVSLPLALRCREAVLVDPSPGMGAEFDASRQEAGIANARRVQSGWLDAEGITGDVVFSADVAYFVRDMYPLWRNWRPQPGAG